ncbi:COG4-domain-containing protein [Teratosphaeria nubilosa]|uniref:Conserved oligomeric Golgi complex subunit 4 n=1 Tax=Teratosphaeria nubilosa TaxID=161662 RepID=A0A6G1LE23_9PEZI|nr:COG4-domain-containing protein [Teratosphaeria nubilosa]
MSAQRNGVNGHHETPNGVYSASSVQEIRAALAELGEREAAVTARLDNLLATQKDLTRQLGRLDLARAQLGAQVVAARAISNGMLSNAASTAHRISGAVKRLDHEQANVKATLEVVEQVAELKACVLGVTGLMGAPQDWETAANYLYRASRVPDSVIDGAFAEEIVPTAEVPDPPRQTLNAAAESLCGLFLREFDKAAKAGDGSSIARFFKLFPLINRSDVGLDAYGRYVCSGIAARARANLNTAQKREGMFYANALTKLFEHIAEIVDGHEPLVERHYGAGSMVKVIQRIQVEADVQGGIILDTWSEERRVSRKLTDVKSYPFNFLAQGLLASQKPALPASGRGSPAPASGRPSEDDSVDTKDVDALLSECAVMLGRWSLYTRFIASKAEEAEQSAVDHGLTVPTFIANSTLHKKISDLLIEPFNLLATFFFRRAVEKAFQLDESPSDLSLNPNKALGATPPFITSAVDDVMYSAQQVMQRTLSTSQRATAASIIPAVGRVLTSDFFGITQRKMQNEAFPKAAIQGALPPESIIIQFMLLMNNLDIATEYAKRIVQSCLGPSKSLADAFPFGHDSVFVAKTLHSIQHSFESKTWELIDDAVDVMLRRVIRPRLQPVLVEAFRDVDYGLTSESEAEADGDDGNAATAEGQVPARFERGWQAFMLPIKRILTPSNYNKLLLASCTFLSDRLQKRLWSYDGRVSELGAVRLERDFAGIVAAAVKGGEYGLRNVFAKVVQMTLVINMEADEWEEVEKLKGVELDRVSGVEWKLDQDERRRVRGILSR